MSRNRVVRHAVADDGLAGVAVRAQEAVVANGRNIGIGAAAVAAVLIGVFVFRGTMSSGEKTASAALAEARSAFTQGQVERAATTLAPILQNHAGTPSGRKALLLMGDVELRRGNPAAAETQFRAALGKITPSDYLWFIAERGLAASLENQSKFAEAATSYEGLLKAPIGNEEKAHALLDAGRAHSLAGNPAGAIAAYDRIIKEFGTSRAAGNAKILKAEAALAGGH